MTERASMTRRQFLGAAAATAAATTGLVSGVGVAPAAAAARLLPRPRLGLSLYTVRGLLAADLEATLAMVADAGLREVEIYDLFGRTPEQFRAILRSNHLRPISLAVWRPPILGGTNADQALDQAEALGVEYTTSSVLTLPVELIPSLGEPQTADLYHRLAEMANTIGAACAERGIKYAYHNHGWEFGTDPATGERFYDILLEETDPELVYFEMDTFWFLVGGVDPVDYLVGNEERFPLFHVKDGVPQFPLNLQDPGDTDLGEGLVDFARIFSALRHPARHHYLLERDVQPNPEQTVREGAEFMRELRGDRGRRRF